MVCPHAFREVVPTRRVNWSGDFCRWMSARYALSKTLYSIDDLVLSNQTATALKGAFKRGVETENLSWLYPLVLSDHSNSFPRVQSTPRELESHVAQADKFPPAKKLPLKQPLPYGVNKSPQIFLYQFVPKRTHKKTQKQQHQKMLMTY